MNQKIIDKLHKLISLYEKIDRRVGKRLFDYRLLIDKSINAKNPTAVNYFNHPKFTLNFGDLLTPCILRNFGMIPISDPINFNVVCVGSVLELIDSDFKGYIIGSGLLFEKRKIFTNANILALRGKLTQQMIKAPTNIILGDPGLLVDQLINKSKKKNFEIGLVPHYVDKFDNRLLRLSERFPGQVKIIDVQREPISVLRDIERCNYILSSSLHGLVSADSLGIPNGWIELSDKVWGSGFKFYDYASALDYQQKANYLTGDEEINELIQMTHHVSPKVEIVKHELSDVIKKFREEIINNKLTSS